MCFYNKGEKGKVKFEVVCEVKAFKAFYLSYSFKVVLLVGDPEG